MRGILLLAAMTPLVLASASGQAQEEKKLNIYNWSDYIAEDTIANFETETGIDVTYDVFDSNEVLEAKLLTGSSGYDLVVPTADFLDRQIRAGVFMPLDKSKLPNLDNMDDVLMERVAAYDPDNAHAIIYMWGTTGFGYNAKMIEERMPDAPVDSFAMLYDPAVVAKFADCGVSLLDAPKDVVPTVLNYLGLDPNSEDLDDLAKAEELLLQIRPYIRYFHSSQYINDLANGEICLALGWSGDILQARDRAAEAGRGVEIKYTIPKEGTILWFDLMAIPADAPHPETAHMFMNYLMEPEVMAGISNYVFYANANAAATEFVDDAVKNDPGIYPSDEVKEKLFSVLAHPPRYDRALTRTWTKVKTGQ
jgi:putrescine transport system substrate-binding protein